LRSLPQDLQILRYPINAAAVASGPIHVAWDLLGLFATQTAWRVQMTVEAKVEEVPSDFLSFLEQRLALDREDARTVLGKWLTSYEPEIGGQASKLLAQREHSDPQRGVASAA
jgi:hypothetical protein